MNLPTKRHLKQSRGELLFLLIAGFLMGSIFLLNANLWKAPLDSDEAVAAEGIFSEYQVNHHARQSRDEVIVRFTNLEQQSIGAAYVNDQLLAQLDQLTTGDRVSLLLHPNSSTIVGMTVNGHTVLDFNRVQEISRRESAGFTVFGLFLYAIALFAAVSLMKGRKQ